jgi:glycosyltransferase involved in cell wall biosynthesis
MAALAATRADRIFVSTQAWEKRLPARNGKPTPSTWLPIPSNLPLHVEPAEVEAARRRVMGHREAPLLGHFGTYNPLMRSILSQILPEMLRRHPNLVWLLIGRNSDDFRSELTRRHPDLAGRIVATGGLSPQEASAHLKACDILVQPYSDGVTSRRGSLMAGLALGTAIVTNSGEDTDELWTHEGAIALAQGPSAPAILSTVEGLLAHPERCRELSEKAASLYRAKFSLERTILTLRAQAEMEDRGAASG